MKKAPINRGFFVGHTIPVQSEGVSPVFTLAWSQSVAPNTTLAWDYSIRRSLPRVVFSEIRWNFSIFPHIV